MPQLVTGGHVQLVVRFRRKQRCSQLTETAILLIWTRITSKSSWNLIEMFIPQHGAGMLQSIHQFGLVKASLHLKGLHLESIIWRRNLTLCSLTLTMPSASSSSFSCSSPILIYSLFFYSERFENITLIIFSPLLLVSSSVAPRIAVCYQIGGSEPPRFCDFHRKKVYCWFACNCKTTPTLQSKWCELYDF